MTARIPPRLKRASVRDVSELMAVQSVTGGAVSIEFAFMGGQGGRPAFGWRGFIPFQDGGGHVQLAGPATELAGQSAARRRPERAEFLFQDRLQGDTFSIHAPHCAGRGQTTAGVRFRL